MAMYRLSIKLIGRGGGRSIVAAAAYRSGEKLHNDETGLTHDFSRKGGIELSEVLLPENAPTKYLDRQILWNEVQKVEIRSNAQFAREIQVSFPYEMTKEERIECIRSFIQENFVSKGMIADWAYHNPEPLEHNPHAHILLSCRGFNEDGEWNAKTKTVFANERDEHGRAVYNPEKPSYDQNDRENTAQYRIPVLDENGNQKTRERKGKGVEKLWERITIPQNDWNDHKNAEIWRASWAEHCNRYLAPENQIDHRSYARQGIDKVPTIYAGISAIKIEEKGGFSERMEINRGINQQNVIRAQIKAISKEITEYILQKARNLYERIKGVAGHHWNLKEAGRDGLYSGVATGRDRQSEGAVGRIDALKRAVGQAEQLIAETDRKIADLIRLKQEGEDRLYERFEALKTRRFGSDDGRNAERNRASLSGEQQIENLRSATADIEAFLRDISIKEQNLGTAQKTGRAGLHF